MTPELKVYVSWFSRLSISYGAHIHHTSLIGEATFPNYQRALGLNGGFQITILKDNSWKRRLSINKKKRLPRNDEIWKLNQWIWTSFDWLDEYYHMVSYNSYKTDNIENKKTYDLNSMYLLLAILCLSHSHCWRSLRKIL